MDAERRRVLIGALVVLASLRFLILPWIDQQTESREQLEVLTKRLDRSTGVVLNRGAITDALSRLEKANTVDRQLFPQAVGAEAFRLDAQQRVTRIVDGQGLQIEVFDWILDGQPDASGLGFVRGRIFFKGDLRKLAFLIGSLEGELPNMVIREALYGFEYPVSGNGEHRTQITLIADFHFRSKASQ